MNTKNILLVGGTHGNELTGVYLIQQWQQQPELIQRAGFTTHTLLANPAAIEKNKRYVEKDLNRCFSQQDLDNPQLHLLEEIRAKEIVQQIKNDAIDFVIDLHTTTSNMGVTLVIQDNLPRTCRVAAYVQSKMPDAHIFYEPCDWAESVYLFSLGKMGGILIEVGPTPQGLLRADIFEKTAQAVQHTLDGLALYDQDALSASELTVYEFLEKIPFPQQNKQLNGMVHPQLQDRDYQPLKKGDPLFLTFAGETLTYQGEETVYPVFINEAAYYDTSYGIAQGVTLMRKTKFYI